MSAPTWESPADSARRRQVREFFDRQPSAAHYAALREQASPATFEAGAHLNRIVAGRVLTVGGVWEGFTWGPDLVSLTVLDLSREMLREFCPSGAHGVLGDVFATEFRPESFDAVVLTLMLHHVADGGWRRCQERVAEAVARVRRWLRPGGRVHILECCPHPVWQPVQRALLPVTRWFLARNGQPLVVMHTRRFYETLLTGHYGACETQPIVPEGFNAFTLYPVFMGVPWLRVPIGVYPKLFVFSSPAVSR